MSSTVTASNTAADAAAAAPAAAPVANLGARHARWQFWGAVMVVPYLLVFVVFVLYPVGYGLWLPAIRRAT
jgi:multiple sugar transport system permease protein